MAGRKLNDHVEISGPLFDPEKVKIVKDAIAEGMADLGEEGAGIMMGFISAGGFVRSGSFLRSVESEVHRSGGGVGWVKVYPTDVWPTPDRPTRDWMETGRRGGQRLRSGTYAFRKTAQRLNTMKHEQFILPKLIEALT